MCFKTGPFAVPFLFSMNLSEFEIIHEDFFAARVTELQLDHLLAEGWRHFGKHFFRYNVGFYKDELRLVLPLRVRVGSFRMSKSQRRVWSRNSGRKTIIRPAFIDDQKHALFERHVERFAHGKPESIYAFLDIDVGTTPCRTVECAVYDSDRLAAVSFLDIGEDSVSSIYAMFEPEYSKSSLGIYTMLLELDFAQTERKAFYYQGYAYEGDSFYDYKKQFAATEVFDWHNFWRPFETNR